MVVSRAELPVADPCEYTQATNRLTIADKKIETDGKREKGQEKRDSSRCTHIMYES